MDLAHWVGSTLGGLHYAGPFFMGFLRWIVWRQGAVDKRVEKKDFLLSKTPSLFFFTTLIFFFSWWGPFLIIRRNKGGEIFDHAVSLRGRAYRL